MSSTHASAPKIFKRKDSPNYWVRFSITGQGQIRLSLGTSDEAEAQRLAQREYQRAVLRAEEGLLAVKSSFEKVAREYIAELKASVKTGAAKPYVQRDYPPVIERYFIVYFGKKPIDAITSGDISRYQSWRQSYWTSGPGKDIEFIEYERHGKRLRRPVKREQPTLSRLRTEASLLRSLFTYAVKQDYIRNGKVPLVEIAKAKASPRPSFTKEEMNKLLALSAARVEDPENRKDMLADRVKLDSYINLAAFTGMRPTELKNLNWGDVLGFTKSRTKPLGEQSYRIRATGKKASHRDIVPMDAANAALEMLWNIFELEVGREPQDDDPVFSNADGSRIQSFKKGLAELLKAADLLHDRTGNRRSSYSFRHYYISRQILDGVDIFAIAINTRTSVQMIQQYYASELIPDDVAERLRGGRRF